MIILQYSATTHNKQHDDDPTSVSIFYPDTNHDASITQTLTSSKQYGKGQGTRWNEIIGDIQGAKNLISTEGLAADPAHPPPRGG